MAAHNRPLSPHLQIYQWQLTAVMSILHRGTGAVLALGILPFVYWLMAIAGGEASYNQAHHFLAHPIGLLMLFGWTFALFYHLCNGIRHLMWDAGWGFDIKTVYQTGLYRVDSVLTPH
ncbi:MAG: succinate dehydrogenase, cytochrome b556 subunit [Thiotrichaceae bacterium]